MAVNGIRVSALPEMIASDLTNDDYLIVNDANTNTRRINYEEFLKSVNTDISDLDVVQSVNELSGVVSLDAADVGAPSLAQFQALETTSNAAGALAIANASDIVTLKADTATNTSGIATNKTDIATNTGNIATNTSGIATNTGNIVTNAADIVTNETAIAELANGTTNQDKPQINGSVVTATGAELNQLAGVTLGSAASSDTGDFATAAQGLLADSALQSDDIGSAASADTSDFATAAQGTKADSALQSDDIGTAAAEDVGYFATAAQGLLADSAVQPEVIGTAAAEDVGYFATAAQGTKADSAVQPEVIGTAAAEDVGYFATAAQGTKADTALQSVPATYSTKLEADALYAPISVDAVADANAALLTALAALTDESATYATADALAAAIVAAVTPATP